MALIWKSAKKICFLKGTPLPEKAPPSFGMRRFLKGFY
jgi:hypothetical protein